VELGEARLSLCLCFEKSRCFYQSSFGTWSFGLYFIAGNVFGFVFCFFFWACKFYRGIFLYLLRDGLFRRYHSTHFLGIFIMIDFVIRHNRLWRRYFFMSRERDGGWGKLRRG
jgi:hypothetical protein